MNDLRFAFRQLLKNPGFTAVAVLTLALGIGANTAIFSVVYGVMFRPLPYPDSNTLVALSERNPRRGIDSELVSLPNLLDWRKQNHVFETIASYMGETPLNLVDIDGVKKVRCAYAESAVFTALKVNPLLGRTFLPEEDQNEANRVAVLSYELWQRQFGGASNILGQTVTIDSYGQNTYSVVGVMPPGFRFPGDCELWLPAGRNGTPSDRRDGHWLSVIGRLKRNVSLTQAGAEMNTIQSRLHQVYSNQQIGSEVAIVPLLDQTIGRNLRSALLVLWGVVLGVLLIACSNVANLMLARAASRQKEIALRQSLGASRGRIIRQLIVESLLISFGGGVLGVLLGYCGLKLFDALNPGNIPRFQEVTLDRVALLFTLLVAVFSGLLFGLAPAWQFSRPDLNEVLKESSRGASVGPHTSRTRSFFVVAEIAMSLMLLVAAGLMVRTFARLSLMDRGFEPAHLLTAELDFSTSGYGGWTQITNTRPQVKLAELLDELRQQVAVQAVGAASELPKRSTAPRQEILIEGLPSVDTREPLKTGFNAVTPGYFRALGAPLLQGRDFTDSDELGAANVVIINETMARRFFPNESPIGKRIAIPDRKNPLQPQNSPWERNGPWREIVGVVADVKNLSLSPLPVPETYVSYRQWPMRSPTVVVRTAGNPAALIPVIRNKVATLRPSVPPARIQTMTHIISESIAQPRFHMRLLTLFGILALLLAGVGLYGILAYTVAQRTHEIGIRVALGAQKRNVLSLVIGQGMKLALIGVGVGAVAALALTRVMRNLLYEVNPTDLLTFACVAILLLGVAFLACWLPARRAARVDPMEALRYE